MKSKLFPEKNAVFAVFSKNRVHCLDTLAGEQREMGPAKTAVPCLFMAELFFQGRFLRKTSGNKPEYTITESLFFGRGLAMSQWYYQLFGEEFGPVSSESLRELLHDGTLSAADKVRSVSSAEWIAAEHAAADLNESSDMANDLSELSFEFEEAGPTSRRGAYQSSVFATEAVTATQIADVADSDDAAEDNELRYFVQVAGKASGPVTIAVLIRQAETGELLESTLVRSEDEDAWQSASEIHELSVAFLLRGMDGDSPSEEQPAGSFDAKQPAASGKATDKDLDRSASLPRAAAAQKAADIPGKKKKQKKGNAKVANTADDVLANELLSEVFSEEEPAAVVKRPGLYSDDSAGATAASGAPAGTSRPTVAPMRPQPASAPAPMSAVSQAAGAAAQAYAPASKSRANKSAGRGIQLEFGTPARALVAILLAAGLWFAYGPVTKMFKPETDRYVKRMELAVQTLDALNPKTQAVTYKGQMSSIGREFGAYATAMNDAGASSEPAKNCLGALNKLVELSKADMKDLGKHKTLLDEAKAFLKAYRNK